MGSNSFFQTSAGEGHVAAFAAEEDEDAIQENAVLRGDARNTGERGESTGGSCRVRRDGGGDRELKGRQAVLAI